MDSDFYSATAQISVVLLLAATLESKFTSVDMSEKSLFGFVARLLQIQLFLWGGIALFTALIKLSDFSAEWFVLGKMTVFVSLFMMFLLLVASHILSLSSSRLSKQGVAALGFVAIPMIFTTVFQYAEIFTDEYVDVIFINIVTVLIIIASFISLLRNKEYLIQLQQILGVHPMSIKEQKRLNEPLKKPTNKY